MEKLKLAFDKVSHVHTAFFCDAHISLCPPPTLSPPLFHLSLSFLFSFINTPMRYITVFLRSLASDLQLANRLQI